MNILIIEDDKIKCARLEEAVRDLFATPTVLKAHSYRTGLDIALTQVFDLIVLDMTLPTFEAGAPDEPMHYGGKEILFELIRRKKIVPTIVVTGFTVIGPPGRQLTFTQLRAELIQLIGSQKVDMIYYSSSTPEWRSNFSESIKNLLSNADPKSTDRRRFPRKDREGRGAIK